MIDSAPGSVLSRSDGMILFLSFLRFMYYYFSITKKANGFNDRTSLGDYGLLKSLAMLLSGLVGLTLGAKWIIDGAVFLALKLGVSETNIGLSVVAFGTSLPELVTALMAAYRKKPEIAMGTIVGSNIFNIFLVLGTSAIIRPMPFSTSSNFDIAFVILASIMLFCFIYLGVRHRIEKWNGYVFLVIYFVYVIFIFVRH